jgi:hypothetical protein
MSSMYKSPLLTPIPMSSMYKSPLLTPIPMSSRNGSK